MNLTFEIGRFVAVHASASPRRTAATTSLSSAMCTQKTDDAAAVASAEAADVEGALWHCQLSDDGLQRLKTWLLGT